VAVTKQTYTAAATWTASQLADIFRDAFIDAGLMTDWHDSFLSGSVENRVLEVIYNAGATYGKTYYWFQFTTTGVFIHLATGWNTASDIPSGTQYLDYFATTTNATTNHQQILATLTTTDVSVIRYSSGDVSGFTWFVLRNGTTFQMLHIPRAAAPIVSWIDLNKSFYHLYGHVIVETDSAIGAVRFGNFGPCLRRSYLGGAALRGATTAANYNSSILGVLSYPIRYCGVGNVNNQATSNSRSSFAANTILPTNFNNTNPAYATDEVPIFTALPYTPYLNEGLPNDFGVAFHYANNTMARFDKLIVTPGTEEWEMLAVTNNSDIAGQASPMFLARVV
jgi:hypothetical protein